MSNIKSIIIGTVIGIILAIVIAAILGISLVGKVKDDYGDEAVAIKDILIDSKDPVLQKDYLLAGLTLSEDFQNYLETGIEKGWWTEEFIIQTGLDNVLHVYLAQFKGVFDAVKDSDTGVKIQRLIERVKPLIPKIKSLAARLDKNTITNLLAKISALRIKLASLDFSVLKARIKQLTNKINNFVNSSAYKKISVLIKHYKNGTLGEFITDKFLDTNLGQALQNLVNNINGLSWEKIKQFIIDAINNSSLGDDLADLINNISGKVEDIKALIERLLQDTEADFDFNTVANADGDVVLPDGTTISARLLNALDIEITQVVYNNNSTPLNLNDDTLTIGQIAIGFESVGERLYLATANLNITGKNCITLNTLIPIINSTI